MNKKILFLFSTHEGQTEKIVDHLINRLSQLDAQFIKMNIAQQIPEDLESYTAVVIASSIRYGKYHPKVVKYVKLHQQQLKRVSSAFIGINLVARKEEKNSAMTNNYTRKFLDHAQWQPKAVAVFAGALYYSRYNMIQRILLQLIMKITGGCTDTTQNIEYTDWQKVDNFAIELRKLWE